MFSTDNIHESWRPVLKEALAKLDQDYLSGLLAEESWLPGRRQIFNAFSLPLGATRYILFGESPYPRPQSANGCAFWDAAVRELWSPTGFSKPVNKATSLRNLIKMLLVARGNLAPGSVSQAGIAALDKSRLAQTLAEVFLNLQGSGFLLLNATPVFRRKNVRQDARAWRPFIDHLLTALAKKNPGVKLVLLGGIAREIAELPGSRSFSSFQAEHPYNVSFITNPAVLDFFRPFNLLEQDGA
ncbi:MAG TPA: hypothetical protein PKI19_02695 [Elusimicrobiales bacterium]|nr:hypothetical protein [Elusimicrobiales bacterium]